jgi:hypothetical protein
MVRAEVERINVRVTDRQSGVEKLVKSRYVRLGVKPSAYARLIRNNYDQETRFIELANCLGRARQKSEVFRSPRPPVVNIDRAITIEKDGADSGPTRRVPVRRFHR